MMTEYNNIIDIICPNIIRQVKKNYIPYMNKSLRAKKLNLNRLHKQAKRSQDNNDWLNYKNTKAIVNKEISQNKTKYINNKLDNSNDRWSTIKILIIIIPLQPPDP